jgi:flagellar secretion chaperone FliS
MHGPANQQSYRRAAVQEASSAGLVVILYDILVDDLRQAAAAMRRADIDERSLRLKHGLLVLQLLEGSLDWENGGEAASNLARLYAHIRRQMLAAQFSCDPATLEQQIALLLDVREAWRTIDILAAISARSAAPAPVRSSSVTAPDGPTGWSA